mmetsp:Transcript_15001/g.25660  ORF Transcript_15001/g.25660 Transcript_15001/m.25660 type:complete len:347 (+) Transcript_15001:415-1455(+)
MPRSTITPYGTQTANHGAKSQHLSWLGGAPPSSVPHLDRTVCTHGRAIPIAYRRRALVEAGHGGPYAAVLRSKSRGGKGCKWRKYGESTGGLVGIRHSEGLVVAHAPLAAPEEPDGCAVEAEGLAELALEVARVRLVEQRLVVHEQHDRGRLGPHLGAEVDAALLASLDEGRSVPPHRLLNHLVHQTGLHPSPVLCDGVVDVVEDLGYALAGEGRGEDEGRPFELGQGGADLLLVHVDGVAVLLGYRVPLVHHDHARAALCSDPVGEFLILVCDAVEGVNDEKHHVGSTNGLERPVDREVLGAKRDVRSTAHACGVYKAVHVALAHDDRVNRVAGCARDRGYDGAV